MRAVDAIKKSKSGKIWNENLPWIEYIYFDEKSKCWRTDRELLFAIDGYDSTGWEPIEKKELENEVTF